MTTIRSETAVKYSRITLELLLRENDFNEKNVTEKMLALLSHQTLMSGWLLEKVSCGNGTQYRYCF